MSIATSKTPTLLTLRSSALLALFHKAPKFSRFFWSISLGKKQAREPRRYGHKPGRRGTGGSRLVELGVPRC